MKVVTFTSALPHRDIEHAGGKYLKILVEHIGPARSVVVAPPLPNVIRASGLPGSPPHVHITQGIGQLMARLENRVRRLDPGQPPWSLARALRKDRQLRQLVREAAVIDLQWQDTIRLAKRVRRLAPSAEIVGTFHDVQSQKFGRLASAARGRRRIKWLVATKLASVAERRAIQVLDQAVVFSAKDADLLPPGSAVVTVIDPPLASDSPPAHRPPTESKVVFVAMLSRPENHRAALWLLQSVWPHVRRQVPSASLAIIGAGATPELAQAASESVGVELTGFVPDLGGLLQAASVAAVPVHDGAGVKFKTIEALLAGVPVVTTSIGAEGIEPNSLFWGVADDPQEFGELLVSALLRDDDAQRVANEAQRAVTERYGMKAFGKKVAAVYGAGNAEKSSVHL